jgi:predicted ATP-dependent protease
VTFEQSYSGVEGDSASSAELYAILSSLADAPINQSIAVTGSVDQRGVIQPIGGATEKIEGFFDICNSRVLSGNQGVVIPIQNIDNLMLKDEVLEAVKEGKFHLYAVERIEEGIEILTGLPAGELNEEGVFTEGSIFQKVDKKLKSFNVALQNSFSPNKSIMHPNAAPIQDENPEW